MSKKTNQLPFWSGSFCSCLSCVFVLSHLQFFESSPPPPNVSALDGGSDVPDCSGTSISRAAVVVFCCKVRHRQFFTNTTLIPNHQFHEQSLQLVTILFSRVKRVCWIKDLAKVGEEIAGLGKPPAGSKTKGSQMPRHGNKRIANKGSQYRRFRRIKATRDNENKTRVLTIHIRHRRAKEAIRRDRIAFTVLFGFATPEMKTPHDLNDCRCNQIPKNQLLLCVLKDLEGKEGGASSRSNAI